MRLKVNKAMFGVHRNGLFSVISELCYKGTIEQRNCRKMMISRSFSYNSFVKFHGEKILEPQHDHVIFKFMS